MSQYVYANRDRTAIVDETDPGKKWQMKRKDAVRLGLLDETDPPPQARRNAPADTVRSLNAPREDTVRTFSTAPKAKPKK